MRSSGRGSQSKGGQPKGRRGTSPKSASPAPVGGGLPVFKSGSSTGPPDGAIVEGSLRGGCGEALFKLSSTPDDLVGFCTAKFIGAKQGESQKVLKAAFESKSPPLLHFCQGMKRDCTAKCGDSTVVHLWRWREIEENQPDKLGYGMKDQAVTGDIIFGGKVAMEPAEFEAQTEIHNPNAWGTGAALPFGCLASAPTLPP